jgi:hypothetical protein
MSFAIVVLEKCLPTVSRVFFFFHFVYSAILDKFNRGLVYKFI